MKNSAKYIIAAGILLFIVSVIWQTKAIGFNELIKTKKPKHNHTNIIFSKDTIKGDTTKLKYPFKDYSNNPYYNLKYRRPFTLRNPSNIQTSVEYDPRTKEFIFVDRIGKMNFRDPYYMGFGEYQKYEMNSNAKNYWLEKSAFESGKDNGQTNKGLDKYLNPRLNVPIAGFDKIFGSNVISIKPQGSAELIFALKISNNEIPTLPIANQKTVNFDFDEKIQMGVTGQIGDRMKLGINYNTEATFDFENQTTISYTGHEDDIIQSIDAGNVSLPLSGTLITGSHSLFGIKTALKFGRFTMTAVASQQKGETKVIEIQGGAQTNKYRIQAADYEANKHFFLAQYFRDTYEAALKNLPIITSQVTITRTEVWVTNRSGSIDTRDIVAFMDLGESTKNISAKTTFFANSSEVLPFNELNNLYDLISKQYSGVRDISKVSGVMSPLLPNIVSGRDYEKVGKARKLAASEYTLNTTLGIISLNAALNSDEVLAVAFEYTVNGKVYQVGEFSNGGIAAPQALILKLLKGTAMVPKYNTWKLMMKNVYSIGSYQINSENFELNVMYQNDKTGTAVNYISEGAIKEQVLLKVLNLDNLNSQNQPYPDGIFDFIDKATINAATGRIFFPVLEPFGSFLKKQIGNDAIAQKFIYQELYDSTQSQAQQIAEKNKFFIEGSYKSTGSSEIYLNAMNIPQGSVTVTAGGVKLTEGVDYLVDYSVGRVQITKPGLIESSTPIQISLENNSLFNIGTKTLLGAHFNYQFSKKFNIGGTIMHLSEKPLTTKVNIGDEPISNTIWGIDFNYSTNAPWLTKFVDMIPFIHTKEMSTISVTGEFAHLIPGHSSVIDKAGTVYLDDFEAFEVSIKAFMNNTWYLASIPQFQPNLFPEANYFNNKIVGFNRAKLAWYGVSQDFSRTSEASSNISKEEQSDHRVREVFENEIFPNKQNQNGIPNVFQLLNLAFYPNEKGPYNYDVKGITGISLGIEQSGYLKNPSSRWGGIMCKTDNSDFEASNIETIEFWMMDPFIVDGDNNAGGDIYFNLGNISEDVLRDGLISVENGLYPENDKTQTTAWGRVPAILPVNNAFDNNPTIRNFQDVGYDGLSDDYERSFFKTYLDSIAMFFGSGSKAYIDATKDPSNDNYHFYRGSDYDQLKLSILDRYKNYNGLDGNSAIGGSGAYPTAGSQLPDNEDINLDNTLNETEAYFQYKVHLVPSEMQIGKNYITDVVEANPTLRNGQTAKVKWYQFKIPIRSPEAKFGAIEDFKSIRFFRMFLKNFQKPIVIRIGRFSFMSGTWRKYTFNLQEGSEYSTTPQQTDGHFEVTSVKFEENGRKSPVNYVLPPGISRAIDPSNPQMIEMNEGAMLLKVIDLEDGDARAVYKTVGRDLRQYKKLKLDVHAEAINGYTLHNDEVRVFMRIGSDFKQNYYEYEIPLKLTAPGIYNNDSEIDRELVWPSDNRFEINFETLQNVKQKRNEEIRKGNSNVSVSIPFSFADGKNKVTVCGNPNLSNAKTIMIGIRNPNRRNNSVADDGLPKSVEIWVNELRLTDFNEEGGWAANARVEAKLADFAKITIAGSTSKAGFGSIEKKVNERQKEDIYQYDITSNVELGKFFPQRFGVRIPMYISFSERFCNPQYNPLDPDILMKTTLNDNTLSKSQKDSILNLVQDYTRRKSINFTNVQIKGNQEGKSGESGSKIYDISNWTTSYSYSETFISNINTKHNILKEYTASIAYTFNNSNPKYIAPFRNMKLLSSNVFQIIKDFNFYYTPTLLSFRTEIFRKYNEVQLRNISNADMLIPATFKKDFNWTRTFDFKHNLTRNIKIDFTATTLAIVDEPQGRLDKNDKDYSQKVDTIIQNILKLGRISQYHHALDVNWNIPINRLPGLDWTNATVNYKATYDWQYNEPGRNIDLGNTIKNSNTIQFNANANLDRLFNKIAFIKRINDRFQKDGRQSASKEFENIVYTKEKVEFKANESRNISHNLQSNEITVKVFNENGKEVKVDYSVVNKNKVKITSKTDLGKTTVEVVARIPKPENFLIVLRDYTVKALTGIKNLGFTYTENNGTMLPGFKPKMRLLGLETTNDSYAPGLAFVFGEQSDLFPNTAAKNGWLTTDTMLNAPFGMTRRVDWSARATIEPFNNFKIDLSINRSYSKNLSELWSADRFGTITPKNKTYTGNFAMSFNMISTAFWSIDETTYSSEAYTDFMNNRLIVAKRIANQRLNAKKSNRYYNPNVPNLDSKGNPINPDYPNGYSPLSQDVLIPAFLAAYAGKSAGDVTLNPFPAIPLPNWRITYDGLSNLSFIKNYVKTIMITHSYKSTYNVNGYNTDPNFSFADKEIDAFSYVRDKVNELFIPEQQIATVMIDEQFAPLFGIDITWNTNLSTKVEYKRTRKYELNMGSNTLRETYDKEWIIGAAYKIAQLPIFIKSGGKQTKFQSDLNIRADISIRDGMEIFRRIAEDQEQLTNGQKNIALLFSADYTLSERFNIRLFYDQKINEPKVSTSTKTSNIYFGFSIRFTLIP